MHSIKILGTRWFAIFAALAVMLVMTAGGMVDPASAKPGGAGKPDKANQSHVSKEQAKTSAPHLPTAKSVPSKAPSTSTAKSGSGSTVRHPKGNTYQAQSDPDGMENGGVDQPGGQGGVNTSTQDGNNGSGNDSDCEDDNRGKGVPGHCKATHKGKGQGKVRTSQGVCQADVGSDRHGKTKARHVSRGNGNGNGNGLGHSKHEDCPVSSTPGSGAPDTETPAPGETTGTQTPGTTPAAGTPGTVVPGAEVPATETSGTVVPDTAPGTPVAGHAEVLGAQASAPEADTAARAGTNAQVRGVSADAAKSSSNPIKAAVAGVLPNTGAGKFLGLLLLIGLAALAFGAYTLATQRKAGRPTG
jgi:hypothetical protein